MLSKGRSGLKPCQKLLFLIGFCVLPEGGADLNEDGDHSDAVRTLDSLGVVGIQILVVMDQLDLSERHTH